MPNRILKESICLSDNIEALSLGAETLFYRLMVKCDDFGRYDGRPAVLRASCFPLRLDRFSEQNVKDWLQELIDNDLVWLYQFEGRSYLQVTKWSEHQQKRAQHSKWPEPPAGAGASASLQADDSSRNQLQADVSEKRETRSENREGENRESSSAPAAAAFSDNGHSEIIGEQPEQKPANQIATPPEWLRMSWERMFGSVTPILYDLWNEFENDNMHREALSQTGRAQKPNPKYYDAVLRTLSKTKFRPLEASP